MTDAELVLSVPAGKTYDLIGEHLIYSCPDRGFWKYEETKFLTPRTKEDVMLRVYEIAEEVLLKPLDIDAFHPVRPESWSRIRGYLGVAKNKGVVLDPGSMHRFYILCEENMHELPHAPHTASRSIGAVYYSLRQLTSGEPVVTPVTT